LRFELGRIRRRLKPERLRSTLARRPDGVLPFADEATLPPGTALLLDTCVYIDAAADRLPEHVAALLLRRVLNHSTVCLGELAFGLGALRPDDPRSRDNAAALAETIERIAGSGRIVDPDAEAWVTAGMLAGMLARLQGYRAEQRRKALADALLLATARKVGLVLLTANLANLDPMLRLLPDARVAFYRSS
jgi:predicted nucleic acid-binding protein